MVEFETEAQAPLPTIEKSQISSYKEWNRNKHYGIGILFVEVNLGRKYAKILVTNQIIDGDFPYIYLDYFQVGMKDYYLKITNHSPLWRVLRELLIHDGLLSKKNDGAILITPKELKKYLTDKTFTVQGRNLHSYKNAMVMKGGDLQ